MTMRKKKTRPDLRFPGFEEEWQPTPMVELVRRASKPVAVEEETIYFQIGIRSHGRGIFYKEGVTGEELGNKRVFWVVPNALIVNIVFAWEQAVAKTTEEEVGRIASHRFPMYLPIMNRADLDFLLYLFLTSRGKYLLELASPGGAGRNKTLGQEEFSKLKITVPTAPEQRKIATFLSAIDRRLDLLRQQHQHLQQYKKGLMQRLFSQQLRFTDEQGQAFPEWEEAKLGTFLIEHKVRNTNLEFNEVFSVAKEKGVVNQIEHLGRSYASSDTSNYKVTFPGDIIYTKSPTSNFPYGIIKQNQTGRIGIVSVLYGVFKPKTYLIGQLLHYYFLSWVNTFNYLHPLVHKGAKNTMNIGNTEFLNGRLISLPKSTKEQQKIADCLSALDHKIDGVAQQIEHTETYKRGLLQQMFV